MLSVLSRSSRWAGKLVAASTVATVSSKRMRTSWRAEALTAGRSGMGKAAASRQAGVEPEVAERLDEPAVLGDRDEAVGTDRAALWVLPAYQASTAVSTPSVTPICG